MSRTERQLGAWILGGLGNQLFQYAAAYSLAQRAGATLRLDLSHFVRYPLRRYELGGLGIADPPWPGPSPVGGALGRLRRLRQRAADLGLAPQPPCRLISESGFTFQELPVTGWQSAYLHGFWQSPRYFSDQRKELLRRFDPLPGLQAAERTIVDDCHAGETVSVHVRRGDYASDPAVLAKHGLRPAAWYRRSLALVRQARPDCRFIVCSDDPAAAAGMLAGEASVRILDRGGALRDLAVMSACRHHIIANSTFSWWGAWLGREDGMVIAPADWFTPEFQRTTSVEDLFPPGWLRV
jgi:hypothetical protein